MHELLSLHDIPHGKFAHLGGIERGTLEPSEGMPPVDFRPAYGATGGRVLAPRT
jgi:hypothetical protein